VIVITHPEMGLGFWSLLDPVGQSAAVAFADENDARAHIRSWDSENDPESYGYVAVNAPSGCAGIRSLTDAGLEPLMGEMEVRCND
jgi:hypothetical protein